MRRLVKTCELEADIKVIVELFLELGNARVIEGDWEHEDDGEKAKVSYALEDDAYGEVMEVEVILDYGTP